MKGNGLHCLICWLLASSSALLVASGVHPAIDRLTWFLEALPVMAGIAALIATHRRFEFTRLAYQLLWLSSLLMIAGAYYSYAENPVFDWLRVTFDLSRNYYDRLGHLLQGFAAAIVARELLLRLSPLRPGKWLFFIVTCTCLGLSASYEIVEWWVTVALGQSAEAFLGLQGDEWDSQWDMFVALSGALIAQVWLASAHDRQIADLTSKCLHSASEA